MEQVEGSRREGDGYLCREFVRQQRRDPRLAEIVLIHEALHTLGLEEAPGTPTAPTADEIMRHVAGRCGG